MKLPNEKVVMTFAQVLIKTLSMVFLLKLAAKSFSVEEFAYYSQFLNVNQVLILLSGAWCTTGVVSLIVSNEFNDKEILSTSVITSSLTSIIFLIVIVTLFVFFPTLLTITDIGYKTLIFLSLSSILNNLILISQSRLNAYDKILELSATLIILSIVNLLMGVIFYFSYPNGMHLYLPVSQVVAFLIINKKYSIIRFINVRFFRLDVLISLCKFILMGAVTIGCVYLSQIFLREYFISRFDSEWVGFWQVSFRLSELYLMLFSAVFSIFIIPIYAKENSKEILYHKSLAIFKLLVPIAFLGLVLQFALKKYIILIAFNSSYLNASSFYNVQIFSDFFKILAWAFCYVFLAKGNVKKYISIEVFSCIVLIVSSILYSYFGIEYSLNFAYLTQSFIYLVLSYCLLFRGRYERDSFNNNKVS